MNTLLTITGPTAIGKTALSIKIAHFFKSDILSCDSRQFYKEMTIGTAVPDQNELAAVQHHFIQNRSIFENYNVGNFEKEALKKLETLFQKNSIQIMVGGSGLYADAVLKGLDFFPDVDPKIRENLNLEFKKKGIKKLQEQLKKLDINSYNTISVSNPHRLIRALEICIGTGKSYSSFINKQKNLRKFQSIKTVLTADREVIYGRINKRVDIMIQNGLIEEAEKLYPHKNLNALQTVGYKELFQYFDGHWDLDIAISEIKKNTRKFAKRQLTWLKKDTKTIWFDYQDKINDIIHIVKKEIN